MKVTQDCEAKVIFYNCTDETIFDDVIGYYKEHDKYIYHSLKKEQLKGKKEKFKELLENGGGSYLLKRIMSLPNDTFDAKIELYDDDQIAFIDDDTNDLFTYNEELGMYVNIENMITVNPDNHGTNEMIFFTYAKVFY
ncbi:hypothetical protein Indivirus_2_5 [Indivirus ILV1]|uniref:Uncharacterized protein n=1 Tax=Indivirus ILV1 TaxID=1977633 RepID=A0A1V0SD36_9VIRU|nr:hypothetical protein Indivirus_2_5 [Indivirus ILV1]